MRRAVRARRREASVSVRVEPVLRVRGAPPAIGHDRDDERRPRARPKRAKKASCHSCVEGRGTLHARGAPKKPAARPCGRASASRSTPCGKSVRDRCAFTTTGVPLRVSASTFASTAAASLLLGMTIPFAPSPSAATVVVAPAEGGPNVVSEQRHLVAGDLRPRSVVADEGKHPEAVAYEGIHLGEPVPGRAVPPEEPHVALGAVQLRREREPGAVPQRPERPRVEPRQRPARRHDVRRRGDGGPSITHEGPSRRRASPRRCGEDARDP